MHHWRSSRNPLLLCWCKSVPCPFTHVNTLHVLNTVARMKVGGIGGGGWMMTVTSQMNESQKHEQEHQLRQLCVPVCVAKGIMMLMMLNCIIMRWCQKVLQCVMQCVADDVKRHYHPAKGTIIMIMPFAGIYNASQRYMPHAHTQAQDASMHNCLSSRSLSLPPLEEYK